MDKLYSWSAKRAGGGISISHSCGKITGVVEITVLSGKLIAIVAADRYYELVVA